MPSPDGPYGGLRAEAVDVEQAEAAFWDDDPAPVHAALGQVLEGGRGSLPFALLLGESLVASAAWALGEAGVELVDLTTPWSHVVESGLPLVLHDPLCPLVPPSFVRACIAACVADDAVVVGVLAPQPGAAPQVASPVVVPASVVARLDAETAAELAVDDLAAVVRRLGAPDADGTRARLRTLAAPELARRVTGETDLAALEELARAEGVRPGA